MGKPEVLLENPGMFTRLLTRLGTIATRTTHKKLAYALIIVIALAATPVVLFIVIPIVWIRIKVGNVVARLTSRSNSTGSDKEHPSA